MREKLIILVVVFGLIVACSGVASASIITGVDRSYGRSGTKLPIGVFDGETDPMPLRTVEDGTLVYSDRDVHQWFNTPPEMKGLEYVPTFNEDKNTSEINVSYMVTIGEPTKLWMTIDDRIPSQTGELVDDLNNQQFALLLATYRLPCGIVWEDTGVNLTIREKLDGTADTVVSVWMTTEPLPAGSYDFALQPSGKDFYTIGTVPEPATIALLGFGGLALLRRKR